jgi:hypothetical protein
MKGKIRPKTNNEAELWVNFSLLKGGVLHPHIPTTSLTAGQISG